MIVLGSGGHTTQMIILTEMLNDHFDFEYVVSDDDNKSIKRIKFDGAVYVIPRPRRYYDKSVVRSVYLTIYSIFVCLKIVMKSKAVGIVSAGPSLAVPLFIWASIFRKKKIFIESWSRVTMKSTSGRICYYMSDIFFVQWNELTNSYKKSIYAGRLG